MWDDALQNILQMTIFNNINIQKNNPIINTIMSALAIFFMSKCTEYLSGWNVSNAYKKIHSLWYEPSIITVAGKCCAGVGKYDTTITLSSTFGDRFRSLFNYIYNNIHCNDTIFELTQLNISNNQLVGAEDIFIVSQEKPFLINNDLQIYARTIINKDKSGEKSSGKSTPSNVTEIIEIEIQIFSYISSMSDLLDFVENIRIQYLANIEKNRLYSRFIYTLEKTKYEDNAFQCWSETVFKTTRSFDNIFFEGKQELIEKVLFFQNNKSWYYDMGIPYTLGIGLCGHPGTGKTSVIKAISKLLDRHIIVFSLKLIKTRKQLTEFFFEERYNYENKKRSIPFDKKIIVIEDIDCIGDIVKNRELIEDQKQKKNDRNKLEQNKTENIIQTILDNVEDANKTCILPTIPFEDEPITLDDILNLWDGIRETPGRVLIISSNHYDQLDPALIRPGRIDIRLELSYVSHVIISEFYNHFFKTNIDLVKLVKIKEYFYTPCEITNVYITHNRDANLFMERLMQNKKINI